MNQQLQQLRQQPTHGGNGGGAHQVPGKTAVLASLAGVAIGGTLLCMMGISFVSTVILVLISSPLLIIFSPLLFFAGFFFVATLAGFAVTAVMALVGMSTLARIFKSYSGREMIGFDKAGVHVREIMVESVEDMKAGAKEGIFAAEQCRELGGKQSE